MTRFSFVYFATIATQLALTSSYTVNRNRTLSLSVNQTDTKLFYFSRNKTKGETFSKDGEDEGDFSFYFKLADALRNGSTFAPFLLENETTTVSPNGNVTDDPRARIVGGEPAMEGEFKYQLSIRLFGRHHCGASLISVEGEQVGITAAHCLRNAFADDLTLVAGDLMRSDKTGREQERQVIDIVRHENFEFIAGVPSYDIALLFIEKPFDESPYIASIELPKAGQETKGKVLVSGWGDSNPRYYGNPSDRLMKVEVPIVEYATCKKSYEIIIDEFYDHFLCAGYMMQGVYKDSCQGDSGGPVVAKSQEGTYLAGIISWGAGCGIPRFPGVNTKVSSFTDWIDKEVKRYKTDGSSEEDDSSREVEEEGEDTDDNNAAKKKAR